jgi:hypothetical protein
MDPDAIMVLHAFLALPNREKMKVVEAMNEYFDSTEKEQIRAGYDRLFESLGVIRNAIECKCCGRK